MHGVRVGRLLLMISVCALLSACRKDVTPVSAPERRFPTYRINGRRVAVVPAEDAARISGFERAHYWQPSLRDIEDFEKDISGLRADAGPPRRPAPANLADFEEDAVPPGGTGPASRVSPYGEVFDEASRVRQYVGVMVGGRRRIVGYFITISECVGPLVDASNFDSEMVRGTDLRPCIYSCSRLAGTRGQLLCL